MLSSLLEPVMISRKGAKAQRKYKKIFGKSLRKNPFFKRVCLNPSGCEEKKTLRLCLPVGRQASWREVKKNDGILRLMHLVPQNRLAAFLSGR